MRFGPAQMQQQEERRDGSLAVLAPETQDRTTRAMWVVVDLADLDLLPIAQLDRLPDVLAFRHPAIAFDPAQFRSPRLRSSA
jgi:hypothetical protein